MNVKVKGQDLKTDLAGVKINPDIQTVLTFKMDHYLFYILSALKLETRACFGLVNRTEDDHEMSW